MLLKFLFAFPHGVYVQRNRKQGLGEMPVFRAAASTTAKRQKELRCLLMHEWRSKMEYIHTVGDDSALGRRGILKRWTMPQTLWNIV